MKWCCVRCGEVCEDLLFHKILTGHNKFEELYAHKAIEKRVPVLKLEEI